MDAPGTGPAGGHQGPHRRGRHAHHRRPAAVLAGQRRARRRATPPAWPALRAADVAIVGKANLHELACGGTGVNPHFGTP